MDEPDRIEELRRDEKARRRRRNRIVVLLVVTILTVLLALDNRHDVEVEYLLGDAEVRLVWVILVAFAAGAVFERAYTFVRGRRREE